MVLDGVEGLDGALDDIDAVICWLNELPAAVLLLEKRFDGHAGLVVADVEGRSVALVGQLGEYPLEGGDNGVVLEVAMGMAKM